jgi:arsenate reductase
VLASDVVITMGCGDECPFFHGKQYRDRKLDDPAGQGIDAVRSIRDEIRSRVQGLLTELLGGTPSGRADSGVEVSQVGCLQGSAR